MGIKGNSEVKSTCRSQRWHRWSEMRCNVCTLCSAARLQWRHACRRESVAGNTWESWHVSFPITFWSLYVQKFAITIFFSHGRQFKTLGGGLYKSFYIYFQSTGFTSQYKNGWQVGILPSPYSPTKYNLERLLHTTAVLYTSESSWIVKSYWRTFPLSLNYFNTS